MRAGLLRKDAVQRRASIGQSRPIKPNRCEPAPHAIGVCQERAGTGNPDTTQCTISVDARTCPPMTGRSRSLAAPGGRHRSGHPLRRSLRPARTWPSFARRISTLNTNSQECGEPAKQRRVNNSRAPRFVRPRPVSPDRQL